MKKKGKDYRGHKSDGPVTGHEKRGIIVEKPESMIPENDYFPDPLDIQEDPCYPDNELYAWDRGNDEDDDLL